MANKFYHPKDVVEIKKATTEPAEHLSYRIDYFQQTSLKKSSIESKSPIQDNIFASKEQKDWFMKRIDARDEGLFSLQPLYIVKILEAELTSSLIHGMGMGHVRETGLTIHPVYGIPYIPASSVKGLVRSWAIHAFIKGDEKKLKQDDKLTDQEKRFRQVFFDIFGSEDRTGLGQFHDIFLPDYKIKPDVLTVHFPNYYGEKKSPNDFTDDKSNDPKPVSFYTVLSKGKVFIPFTIYKGKLRDQASNLTREQLAEVLGLWIPKAFEEIGAGSKTALGYGRFSYFADVTEERFNNIRERLDERKRIEERKRQEEKLANMTEEERLIYQIENFDSSNPEDVAMSKDKDFFAKVIESKAASSKLKEFWQRTGDWKVKPKKKKQYEKVSKLKEILGE